MTWVAACGEASPQRASLSKSIESSSPSSSSDDWYFPSIRLVFNQSPGELGLERNNQNIFSEPFEPTEHSNIHIPKLNKEPWKIDMVWKAKYCVIFVVNQKNWNSNFANFKSNFEGFKSSVLDKHLSLIEVQSSIQPLKIIQFFA